jgi:hypothetical protein
LTLLFLLIVDYRCVVCVLGIVISVFAILQTFGEKNRSFDISDVDRMEIGIHVLANRCPKGLSHEGHVRNANIVSLLQPVTS